MTTYFLRDFTHQRFHGRLRFALSLGNLLSPLVVPVDGLCFNYDVRDSHPPIDLVGARRPNRHSLNRPDRRRRRLRPSQDFDKTEARDAFPERQYHMPDCRWDNAAAARSAITTS